MQRRSRSGIGAEGDQLTPTDPGFSILDGVFAREEMLEVAGALDWRTLVRTRAGARGAMKVPRVRALAHDPRLLQIAARHLGVAMPFRATLFEKTAGANWLVAWHQDTALPVRQQGAYPGWGPWSRKAGQLHGIAPAEALAQVVALRVHLDDSGPTNGPLRVLPHSHARGVLSHDEIQRLAGLVAPLTCVVAAGGVLAMRPLTVHASSKAVDDRPRRVLHIEYARSLHLDAGVELAVG